MDSVVYEETARLHTKARLQTARLHIKITNAVCL